MNDEQKDISDLNKILSYLLTAKENSGFVYQILNIKCNDSLVVYYENILSTSEVIDFDGTFPFGDCESNRIKLNENGKRFLDGGGFQENKPRNKIGY